MPRKDIDRADTPILREPGADDPCPREQGNTCNDTYARQQGHNRLIDDSLAPNQAGQMEGGWDDRQADQIEESNLDHGSAHKRRPRRNVQVEQSRVRSR